MVTINQSAPQLFPDGTEKPIRALFAHNSLEMQSTLGGKR
jgi:hypothetical protein